MAFDDNIINTSIATAVTDSFNDVEENSLTVDVGVADSFNDDNSVNDSDNTTVGIEDSFQNDSHNTDVDIDDAGNVDSYNDYIDASDHSVNDDSINAGNREYNTGLGDLHFGGMGTAGAAAGGSVLVNNHNTVVDQSSSNNIVADGPVFQYSANEAQVASGADSYAAGDNNDITTTINSSTNIAADGDVLIGSTKSVDVAINSGNSYDFSYHEEDNSVDVDIDDSWNSAEWNTSIDDSFNDESFAFSETDVDIDVNAILGSNGAVIADDITL